MGARLAIVQHGNYAEAAKRFAAGGAETFYAQKYSVDFVARLASRVQELSVLHLSSDDPVVTLPSGVRSLGVRLYPPGQKARHGDVIRALETLKVDHVVLQGPIPRVIFWALARRIRILPIFADSFQTGGLKSK